MSRFWSKADLQAVRPRQLHCYGRKTNSCSQKIRLFLSHVLLQLLQVKLIRNCIDFLNFFFRSLRTKLVGLFVLQAGKLVVDANFTLLRGSQEQAFPSRENKILQSADEWMDSLWAGFEHWRRERHHLEVPTEELNLSHCGAYHHLVTVSFGFPSV